jgi:hypothetical protein
MTREDRRAGRDPALEAAIAALGRHPVRDIAIVRVQAP